MRQLLQRLRPVALIALAVTLPVQASLGDNETSVETDRLAMGATQRTQASPAFTTHELQMPSGTTVREYVTPAGTVFGVAWQGPSIPDLRQLLGSHFDEYVAAMETRRTRRSPVLVQLPGLVVQSSGHMRAFSGRAYLPAALPPNVAPEEIR
jgi:hypothetical protein